MEADEMLWRRLTFAWQNIGPCHSKLGFFAKNAKNFGPCGEPYGSLKVIISKKSENLQKFYKSLIVIYKKVFILFYLVIYKNYVEIYVI